MPELLDNVRSSPEGPGGRSICTWTRKNGGAVTGLLEWTTADAPEAFREYVALVSQRVPTDQDVNRPEEARTLRIDGVFREGPRTALVYECSRRPANLREVLLNIKRPSGDDRRALCRIIATQVRSLHVHFQLPHMALRTESFVFFGDAGKPELTKPYILDWARSPSPSMYQHPDYQGDKPLWSYEIWSLMMILSEIAEWQPLDQAFRDEAELVRRKLERKQLVTSREWKGPQTAAIFEFGFGFLEKNRRTLEQISRWDVKRFYDNLCELLAH